MAETPTPPTLVDLASRRPPKIVWSPVEMLEQFLAECKDGRTKPINMAIHYLEERADGSMVPCVWTANMDHADVIAFAALMQARGIDEWRNPSSS